MPTDMRRHFVVAVLAALGLGIYPMAGCAQQPDSGPVTATRALAVGDYEEARALYKSRLAGADSSHAENVVGYFETFLAVGQYSEGLREVDAMLQQAPNDAYLHHMRGRLLMAVGRYDDAEEALRQAGEREPEYWRNALEFGDLLVLTGRGAIAPRFYGAIYQEYKAGTFRTAAELAVAGRAAALLEDFHDANAAFRTAYQLDPTNGQVLYWWGDLFREKYNDADAQRTFQEALAVNPKHVAVYVGLAKSAGGFGTKEELANRALETNPNSVDALNILAGLRIVDGQYEEAKAMIQRALVVNQVSMDALAHLAAVHFLRDEQEAGAEVEQKALAINPNASGFYITIAEDLSLRFRYPASVEFAQKAVRADSEDEKALATLGTSLLRLGKADEARRYLDRSFRDDPFNLFVGNTLTLLDEYQDFDLLESEHFRLLIHNSESDVLGQLILDEAEASYAAFSERYPYAPPGKMQLEAYNDRDDFAVRVAGIPHLGLLGVSFGDVLALNTPQAQAGREYNWARTLWHEIAHTMAIGVSDFHVPRWFTEGLSVYEEQRARPEWGREMDLELFTAFDQDKLLPLETIDRGFTRPTFPGQILLSYYHASKIIGFIVETYGFTAITDILTALREGQTMEAAIQQVTGQSQADLDKAFLADLRQKRDAFDQVLADLPDLLSDEEDAPSLLEKMSGRSDNPLLQRLQQGGEALEQEDYGTAETRFREAIAIFPDYVGAGNAYVGLDAVYETRDETQKRIANLKQFLSISEFGAAQARDLADLYEEAGNTAEAIRYLERSLQVEPYDLPTHDRLATLYAEQGRHAPAVRSRRAILALNPVDKANAYYELARSLYANDDMPEAKRAVLQSLELAPGFREAQKLLLACVEGGR
ncbi:MAG TPA: tetratricopeptide repeat protein [Rhodothermales bacterium]|nr:tetratricopeptide repeat protein [Rhodothermales bacterium]